MKEDLKKEIKQLKQIRFPSVNQVTAQIKKEIKLQTIKECEEIFTEMIKELNEKFRKNNTPQRLTGDELNDLWEEELLSKLKNKMGDKK